ncbi:hypothetical protein HED55_10035 [Ochrobactrum haematophilum]|uniref:Uncharacterized protein n=1 Tax=Brucella haematophila TaxID=419474 RepID=A0ABX1DKT4_9HYPH|nr:hypothetical protein [Brucella haematophila]
MDTPVTGSIKTNILYKDDQLYLTLLCYGGGDINYQFTRTPFLVTFYDQYGNQGQFLIDPDKLPEGYNPDQFTNSNFTLLSVPTANLLTGQTGKRPTISVWYVFMPQVLTVFFTETLRMPYKI